MACENRRLRRSFGFKSWMVRSRGVSILFYNSWHNVHNLEIDICTLTSFITFFFQFVHKQTQLSCTQHSIFSVHSQLNQKPALSQSCFQKHVQSYCYLVLTHGSGARSLKLPIHEDSAESRLLRNFLMPNCSRT